ncbi:porin [Uliginosibacterium sp. H1]|uniref:porin n=1 Tax=Uliginosibacterium sp. H1 TaxID=3114757 RepID=UPI002E18F77D|nr:porin [Uliginosibacterium sp. H1]
MPFAVRLIAWLSAGLLMLAATLLPLPAIAQPAAGTVIESRATLHYLDGATGQMQTLQSNIVRVILQPVEAGDLTPDQTQRYPVGGTMQMAHVLTNTGNTPALFLLGISNLPGDQFDLYDLTIIHDLNANALADAGEPVITQFNLAPDEVLHVVVLGRLPLNVGGGAARLLLRAATAAGLVVTSTDTVMATDGPVLLMAQSASDTTPERGDTVRLRLFIRNVGNRDAEGIPFTVDGMPMDHVLAIQSIPANTQFVSASVPAGVALLYHRAGDAAMSFSLNPPADLSLVDAVAYAFDALATGASLDLAMDVLVKNIAQGQLLNDAWGWYTFPGQSSGVDMFANTLTLNVDPQATRLAFYTAPDFHSPTSFRELGESLFLQADSGLCNTDASVAETLTVRVASQKTNDTEDFAALETGPNTGIFRVQQAIPTAEARVSSAIPGNGTLETLKSDHVTATTLGCGNAEADLLIDPYGVVFDSVSNEPVAGVSVSLIDVAGSGNGGSPGGAARVFMPDGITPAPSTVTTDAAGRYQFPQVAPSSYRLAIQPPDTYGFPSIVEADRLPAGRSVDAAGSYGGIFPVNLDTGAVMLDVPVDADAIANGIMVEKRASRTAVEIGESIDYILLVKNVSGMPLTSVTVAAQPPPGFSYEDGSFRQEDRAAALQPVRSTRGLQFPLGNIPDAGTTRISYRMKVGPGAREGEAVSRARATSAPPLGRSSNLASAAVRVEGGVFDTKGFILGKVFADCNANDIQDSGEPGVPGVRVWLEDGTWALSDGEGKFSFYNVSPRTHVAKLDATTLPTGARMRPLSNRNAGSGDSRFIDMKNGELHRADFAIDGCDPGVMEDVDNRRRLAAAARSDGDAAAVQALSLDPPPQSTPSGAAAGIVGQPTMGDGSNAVARVAAPTPAGATPAGSAQEQPPGKVLLLTASLEELSKVELDNRLDFLGLEDGMRLAARQLPVRVKGQAGTRLQLVVNDKPLPDSQVGARVLRDAQQLEIHEYIGVSLLPGPNTLRLVQYDPFGNPMGERRIVVQAPGELQRLVIEAATPPRADGISQMKVRVRVQDDKGLSIAARTPVTLESSAGEWLVEDLDPTQPGFQVFVEGGVGEFALRMPIEPGELRLRASSGKAVQETSFAVLPVLREMVAVGVLEGTLSLSKLGRGALQSASAQDGFEDAITHFASSSESGDTRRDAGARAALFLKGKIKGEYLLTLGYDSDKDTQERLFRDIQPDRFYPVYGDSSIKGFDAQSTGHLYVRVDKDKSWLLWGDFNTQTASTASVVLGGMVTPARSLAAYNRSLNGLRHHYDANGFVADSFASHTNSRQIVEEIPANGTSGPYALRLGSLITNSERVEIITRDRRQPSIVLRTVPQARFTDYTLEAFSGSLLFRAPVPTVDPDLNDNFIRVTYEVDQGGDRYWIAGTDLRYMLWESESLSAEVGGVLVDDRNPQDASRLGGANVTLKSHGFVIVGEVAGTRRDTLGRGNAGRIEIRRDSGDLQGRVYYARTDENFDNPSSTLSRGRGEAGAKIGYKLAESTLAVVEARASEDQANGARRRDVLVGVEHSFDGRLKLDIGLRSFQQDANPALGQNADDTNSVRVRIAAPVPGMDELSLFTEVEQAIGDASRQLLAVGGDYRIGSQTRLYGRYEFVSDLESAYAVEGDQRRNTAIFGIDTAYMDDGQAFSEYRARDAFSGREAEAAMGLRNRWRVGDGLRLDTSIERIESLESSGQTLRNESTAITAAVAYTFNADWKATARFEWRDGPTNDTWLNTLGLAVKIDPSWTFLGRSIYSLSDSEVASMGDRVQQRFQAGFAYRDRDTNVWNGLGRYEYKIEEDDTPGRAYERRVHILSTHANVQPQRKLVLTGRYAAKLADEEAFGLSTRMVTQLLSGRAVYELNRDWDVGLQLSRMFSMGNRQSETAAGAEVGYLMSKDMWVSVGYNFLGFRDRDLVEDDSSNRGIYLRLRFKFDEGLFEDMTSP